MAALTESVKKPIIAVDIDEVLAYFVPALVEFHNDSYSTELSSDSFFSYEFTEVWGGTTDETQEKLNVFFDSSHFKEKLNPIPHAYDSLLKLKLDFELHIVTSRQHKVEADTVKWINQHFPNIFEAIHLGNHYSSEGKSRTKSEICHSIGASLLIDDSVKYALQCVRDNIPVILFGNYAWNQVQPHYDDIQFVEYSDNLQVSECSNMMSCSLKNSSDRKDGDKHIIYRVTNWHEVLHLIYATFNINKSSEV